MVASVNKYISVLANECQGDAEVTISLKTVNQVPEDELLFDVTVEPDDTEQDIANKIIQTSVPYLRTHEALYLGEPYSCDGGSTPYLTGSTPVPFTFRPYQTDHTINLFSQTPYRLNIPDFVKTVPVGGVYIVAGSQPVLFTVSDVEMFAAQTNIRLVTAAGEEMSTQDKCNLAIALSAQTVVFLNGKMPTATTYVSHAVGNGGNGFGVENNKVILVDYPKRDAPFVQFTDYGSVLKTGFYVNPDTGFLFFSDPGFMPYVSKPMGKNSFVRMSYIAGEPQIPQALKLVAAQLLPFVKMPQNASRIKVGSYQIDFGKARDTAKELKSQMLQIMGM